MREKISILLLVVSIVVIALIATPLQTDRAKASPIIPDSPDAKQIMVVMDRAYQLLAQASRTFDVSEFPSVFVDTNDYKLTHKQRESVAKGLGVSVEEVRNEGYLTAMRAKYVSMARGSELLQTAMNKAKAENRELTAEEIQEIAKANNGQLPPSTVVTKTVLVFKSIEITGDRAIVRYDDGAALQEAILVKVNGKWFIASIKPIWIHF